MSRRNRVLVVLTDPAELAELTQALTAAGHAVFSASTFSGARKRLTTTSLDLLITDIRLLEFNGLQLIISTPRDRLRGAIVLDAEPDPVLADDATRLGALYLTKPVPPSELCRRVSGILAPSEPAPRPVTVMASTRPSATLAARPTVAVVNRRSLDR